MHRILMKLELFLNQVDNLEDYEYEGLKNNLIKNNIYLGKVSQNRTFSCKLPLLILEEKDMVFLSFNDIQSDYYQIPQS